MISSYGVDPKGRPAVQAAVKKKGSEHLMIAVNTIGTHVEANISVADVNASKQTSGTGSRNDAAQTVKEVFSDQLYLMENGIIRTSFEAYEVKAFLW
jgi:hypothetical protein